MPIHEYQCTECELEFDQLRKYGEQVQHTDCPTCFCNAQKIWRNPPPPNVPFKEGYNEQLGEYVKSRNHLKDVCKMIFDRSGGKTNVEWH